MKREARTEILGTIKKEKELKQFAIKAQSLKEIPLPSYTVH